MRMKTQDFKPSDPVVWTSMITPNRVHHGTYVKMDDKGQHWVRGERGVAFPIDPSRLTKEKDHE
jgi:hypothetical protein